jgi:pimeloyl-ACP methyl ester carboxylesterase
VIALGGDVLHPVSPPYSGHIPNVAVNGIRIEYETFGDPARPALVLIMGLGGQMIAWPEEFCRELMHRGFWVVRFDNRDAGLSTKMEGVVPDVVAAYFGDASSAAYTLEDMADDTVGLLDALGIPAAHLVGISMGGMIAQLVAIRRPERALSLCSMMSTTGDRSVGQPTPEALAMFTQPAVSTREEAIEAGLTAHRVLGTGEFATDDEEARRLATDLYDRAFFPEGVARQLCAILASGDRTERLATVTAPTLVVHGTEDILITPSGGEATARAVPRARLMLVEGLGHELPPDLWPKLMDEIVANAAKGDERLA